MAETWADLAFKWQRRGQEAQTGPQPVHPRFCCNLVGIHHHLSMAEQDEHQQASYACVPNIADELAPVMGRSRGGVPRKKKSCNHSRVEGSGTSHWSATLTSAVRRYCHGDSVCLQRANAPRCASLKHARRDPLASLPVSSNTGT